MLHQRHGGLDYLVMITFKCPPHLYDLIPHPIPAKHKLPDWLKHLKLDNTAERNDFGKPTPTIRRCMPFMDAMSAGWIIPTPAACHIYVDPETMETKWSWDGEWKMIEAHNAGQIGGEKSPIGRRVPLKFINPWRIQVPKGWSVLITAPLNRPEAPFEAITGIVDCDRYPNEVNFPFYVKGTGDLYIEQGTPMVQVIPFKRGEMFVDGQVSALTKEEIEEGANAMRRLKLNPPWYRFDLHVPKLVGRKLK